MAHRKTRSAAAHVERAAGERHDLSVHVRLHATGIAPQTFEPHLGDLGELAATRRNPENVLDIEEPLDGRIGRGVLHDAHRDVGLECHEPAARVGEADHGIIAQKTSVFEVEVVGFELVHTVAFVT